MPYILPIGVPARYPYYMLRPYKVGHRTAVAGTHLAAHHLPGKVCTAILIRGSRFQAPQVKIGIAWIKVVLEALVAAGGAPILLLDVCAPVVQTSRFPPIWTVCTLREAVLCGERKAPIPPHNVTAFHQIGVCEPTSVNVTGLLHARQIFG